MLGQDSPQRVPVNWVPRYLHLLGVEPEAPGLAALRRLTRRHLYTVPFGNITALLRFQEHRGKDLPLLDFDALLHGWERRQGSGVCFEITWALGYLLRELGYDAWPVPGIIGSFMGGHQALVVAVEGKQYLIDVGCGAPLFEPIALDETVEFRHAGLAYRFRTGDDAGVHLQEHWIGGKWSSFCRYELRPQSQAEYEAVYRRHHIARESWVIGELRLVRSTEAGVDTLRKADLTRYSPDGKTAEHLTQHADYVRVARDVFQMPALPVVDAVKVLEGLENG